MAGNRDTGALATSLQIGDVSGGNYCETRTDGTVRLVGDATCWKDMVMDIFGKRLSSTVGKVDYDFDENAIEFSSGGSISTEADRVGGNQQINHEFKVGTSITFKPHIHFWQQVTTGAVDAFVWTMRYRLQNNGEAKEASWTSITCTAGTDDVWDFTGESDGLYNQISHFDDIVVTCEVSDTIQVQLARTDSEGGTVQVYFLDLHGEVDSHGSDLEITKAA